MTGPKLALFTVMGMSMLDIDKIQFSIKIGSYILEEVEMLNKYLII